MRHPRGRCDRCGERLYAHVDGGVVCHNCGARGDGVRSTVSDDAHDDEDEDEDGGGKRVQPPLPGR